MKELAEKSPKDKVFGLCMCAPRGSKMREVNSYDVRDLFQLSIEFRFLPRLDSDQYVRFPLTRNTFTHCDCLLAYNGIILG